MLERYGIIEGTWEPMNLQITGSLPAELQDPERLAEKLRRDQMKLLSLVQFARHEGDRRDFLLQYFGLA
jgi:ATP-dependent DNA helicase RecQ